MVFAQVPPSLLALASRGRGGVDGCAASNWSMNSKTKPSSPEKTRLISSIKWLHLSYFATGGSEQAADDVEGGSRVRP